MPETKIDNVALIYPPSHVQIIPPRLTVYPGPGLGKVVVQPQTPPQIELRFGMQAARRETIAELMTRRGRPLVHMLSWTDEVGGRLRHRNVVIPEIGYGQGPAGTVVDTFSLVCEEIRPNPTLRIVKLTIPGAITIANDKDRWEAVAGGRLWRVGGSITTLGAGAGTSTDFQINNGGTDMLTTPMAYEVDSASNLAEGWVIDRSNDSFDRGDVIQADCDAISTNPADARILLYVLLFGI
ncbi:MAG: hypothetical protein V3V32_04495 [Dehalococcoidia bacterium]